MGNSSVNGPFSIAMVNNQRVYYQWPFQDLKLEVRQYHIFGHIFVPHLGTGRIGRAGTCVTLVTGREKIFKAGICGNLWESMVDFSIEHGDAGSNK